MFKITKIQNSFKTHLERNHFLKIFIFRNNKNYNSFKSTFPKFCFAKKTYKNSKHTKHNKMTHKQSSSSSEEAKSEDEEIKPYSHDKAFEEYIKLQEQEKQRKEIEIENRRKRKEEESVRCLVLHPIFQENKGAQIEAFLAEEAIGLAKSLDWVIIKGPFWKKENDKYNPENWEDDKPSQKASESLVPLEKLSTYDKYRKKKEFQEWKPTNGDYVFSGNLKGVFYNGGVMQGGSETDDDDIYDEWKNILLRESLALSSLLKVNLIKASTFITKGRLHQLGLFLQENPVDVVFINSTLSYVQKRNLEIYFNNYINERNDRIRAYNIKSALKIDGDATDTESNFSNMENDDGTESNSKKNDRRVLVLDRFNIIISIFSQRAQSKISQLQIELAYLKYVKTRLARGGHSSYGAVYKEFGGDFLNLSPATQFEVVSGKQSSSRGSVGGSGETQLEIERRRISQRENSIRELLVVLKEKRAVERESRREKASILPTVALVGYTNAGKTALMNTLANTMLESENKLFQTLNTTIKKIKLPNFQNALLLDTVGFITDLPHELVESFKTTLEEVFYADILIHVIDVSNPSHTFQRKAVYSVLDEIFPKENDYKNRLIEVWNKIDLLDDINSVSGFITDNEFPVIPISVKKKINFEMLYNEIIIKMNLYLGKEQRELRCQPENYDRLYKWVKEVIGQPSEITYDENTQEMLLKIMMDKGEYERYLENFVIMRENKRRKDISNNVVIETK